MEFYVYVWRDASGCPFYVGKGKGKRAYNTHKRSKEFKEVYAGGGCTVEIVDWFIHESQAHSHEVELIESYGRRFWGGTLVNKTDGGEGMCGWVPSLVTRAKWSAANKGKTLSRDHRSKLSVAASARVIDPETRKKIGASNKGIKKPNKGAEHKARISAAKIGIPHSLEHREKIGVASRLAPPMSSSGYKGVSFYKSRGYWTAAIHLDGVKKSLGRFSTPDDAARAYDKAAFKAWGLGGCYINFPDGIAANDNKTCDTTDSAVGYACRGKTACSRRPHRRQLIP